MDINPFVGCALHATPADCLQNDVKVNKMSCNGQLIDKISVLSFLDDSVTDGLVGLGAKSDPTTSNRIRSTVGSSFDDCAAFHFPFLNATASFSDHLDKRFNFVLADYMNHSRIRCALLL